MPNYDLGIAHGRIKIDADTKGVTQTEAELAAMAAEVQAVTKRLSALEDALNDYEAAARDSGKASDSFAADLRKMVQAAQLARQTMPHLVSGMRGLRKVTNDFNNNPGFLRVITAMTPKMLLLRAAAAKATYGLVDYNRAMMNASNGTKSFLNIAGKIAVATSLYAGLRKYGGFLGNIVKNTGAFTKAAGLANRAVRELTGTAAGGQTALAKTARGLLRIGVQTRDTAKMMDRNIPNMARLFGSLTGAITGGLLIKQAGRNFKEMLAPITKIPKKFLAIGAAVVVGLRPLAELGAKGLVVVSNLAKQLGNSVVTLAGGFLALPGAIAGAITTFGTLSVLGKALTKTFEGVFAAETPEDLAAAIDALPEHLRGTGKALADVKKITEDLQNVLVDTFNSGLESDIRRIGDLVGGPVQKGMQQLTATFGEARSAIIDFVTSKDTVADLNRTFALTNQTVRNLVPALLPVAAGFRDIGVTGLAFIRDLSGGAAALTQRFAEWAAVNRENGNLMKWMKDGKEGLVDLSKGIIDATQGLWGLLTLFATDTGENSLERFAKQMQRFDDWVKNSKIDGVLKKIGDTVKNLGTAKLENLMRLLQKLGTFGNSGGDIFEALEKGANAFVGTLIKLLTYLEPLINVWSEMLQFMSPVVGKVLAMSAAFKVAMIAIKPLQIAFAALFGGAMIGKAVAGMGALALKVGQFGKLGAIASTALTGLGLALSAATKGLLGAAAAFLVYKLAMDEGQRQMDEFRSAHDAAVQNSVSNAKQLAEAFSADNGERGDNVFTQIRSDMEEMMTDLNTQVQAAPGLMAKFNDFMSGGNRENIMGTDESSWQSTIARAIPIVGSLITQPTGSSDDLNKLEKQAEYAEKTKAAFDALGISSEALGEIASGSAPRFQEVVTQLRGMGEGGELAASKLSAYRDQLSQIEATNTAAGAGGQQLAAGIQALADAGGDATAQLDGLKTALQGLGLLQTSSLETAFAYADAVRNLGNEAASAAAGVSNFDDILNQDGGWNTASVGAAQLFNVLQPISELFLRTATDTGNAQQAFADLQPQIKGVADAFHKSEGEINNLLSTLGVDQTTVGILLQISGLDDVDQKVAQAMLAIQNAAKQSAAGGIPLPVTVVMDDPAGAAAKIRELLGAGAVTGENAGGFTIPASVIADPNALRILAQSAKEMGLPLNFPGQAPVAPGDQPKIPAQVETQPPAPGAKPPTQAVPSDGSRVSAPQVADPATVPSAKAPDQPVIDTAQLDQAKQEIGALKAQISDLNANPPKVEVDPAQFEALKAGTQSAVAAFNEMKAGIVTALGEAQNAVIAWTAGLSAQLSALASQAFSWGAQIGSGLANGLKSQQGAVEAAAAALAGAVAANTKPGSPTKRGPLSGQGWVGYSGAKTALAYADALRSGVGAVDSAAGGLAGAVAGNLNTQLGLAEGPGDRSREFLGQLKQLSDFAKSFVDVGKRIADSLINVAKFMSDPMGKGTFFGMSPGKAFGYKKDTSVSENERLQEKLNSTTAKALTEDQKKVEAQKKADAEKQAELNAEAINGVIAGNRVAAPEEAKKTESESKTDKTLTDVEKAAKSQADFDKTAQQAAADMSAKLDSLTPAELAKVQSGEVSVKTDDQVLAELTKQTPLLSEAVEVSKLPNATEEQSLKSLNTLNNLIDSQGEAKTPAQKQQMGVLEGIRDNVKSNAGLTEGDNPIDQAGQLASNAASVAGDIFAVVDSVFESIDAAKQLTDTLTRGIANSEDVFKMVDNVQSFIKLGGDIAGAVSGITGLASSMVGAAAGSDPSGGASGAAAALGMVSTIAGLVQAGYETANAVIDLGQEAYRIIGSYVGDFLGILTGGGGSALAGDVKFLLDTRTNQLLTYASNNPQDKRTHDGFGGANNPDQRNQGIGQINVYGGPGSDPRDNTRQMMFQVRAANFAGAAAS